MNDYFSAVVEPGVMVSLANSGQIVGTPPNALQLFAMNYPVNVAKTFVRLSAVLIDLALAPGESIRVELYHNGVATGHFVTLTGPLAIGVPIGPAFFVEAYGPFDTFSLQATPTNTNDPITVAATLTSNVS